VPLHSHRAPAVPLSERGRTVVVTATLLGVGVAGMSTATGDAALSHPRTAAGPAAAGPAAAGAPAPVESETATPDGAYQPKHATAPAAAAVRASRAPRPVVVEKTAPVRTTPAHLAPAHLAPARQRTRPAPVARWVHPMPEARVTSCFGQRWGRLHAGVDLAAPHGTPVRAAGAGTVVTAGVQAGYGNAVLIDHGNGYLTHYGHLAAIGVQAGDRVVGGAQIGNEGSTGHSTGPHLHFEVHEGSYKNPIEPTAWLHAQGADITGCVALTDD
jgi:murein DD-endopeptidase MepM/ murein hydrolase activator NlpD